MDAVWKCTLFLVQTANVVAIQPCFEDDPRQRGMDPLSWTLPSIRTVSVLQVKMRCDRDEQAGPCGCRDSQSWSELTPLCRLAGRS